MKTLHNSSIYAIIIRREGDNLKNKKIVGILLSIALALPLAMSGIKDTTATNFSGNESKYYKLCSSSKLTKSEQSTCKEFNSYLKDKSSSLKSTVASNQNDVDAAKLSLEKMQDKIDSINAQIKTSEARISYINTSIKNTENQIKTKQEKLKERVYAMQNELNSNMYISYLFGAQSFSDFFSRAATLSDLTAYEEELMQDIKDKQASLESQKVTLKETQATLTTAKASAAKLEVTYKAKLEKESAELRKSQGDLSDTNESIETIAKNLAAIKKASDASKVSGVTKATNTKVKTTTTTTTTTTGETETTTTTSDSEAATGLAIANKALTRLGYMYLWGGCHSMSQIKDAGWTRFDCSGLVNWAFYQSGVNIGSNTTRTLVSKGSSVSRSNLQAGDIILFSSNGSSSGVHHVGIYIGNNQMVHAPCTGKAVQVANLSNSYWQSEWLTARRLY